MHEMIKHLSESGLPPSSTSEPVALPTVVFVDHTTLVLPVGIIAGAIVRFEDVCLHVSLHIYSPAHASKLTANKQSYSEHLLAFRVDSLSNMLLLELRPLSAQSQATIDAVPIPPARLWLVDALEQRERQHHTKLTYTFHCDVISTLQVRGC